MAPYVSITIEDEKAAISTFNVYVPSGTTPQDVLDFAADLSALVVPLITGVITRVAVCLEVASPSMVMAPGADVEEGGQFQFNVTGGNVARITVPTFDETLTVATGIGLDTNDPSVAAFIDALENGLTVASTNTVSPVDYRDGDLAAPVKTYQTFGGKRARSGT